MKRMLALAWLALAACSSTTEPRASTEPFAYDRSAPLALELGEPVASGGVTEYEISYASPSGGRVRGFLMVPSGPGPFAGVVAQHGMPGTAAGMSGVAYGLARRGAVVIAIDAPFNRRGGGPVQFTVQDRIEQIQLIRDLQRAVDVLLARGDVAEDRLGYVGISYGAAMGALFAGVERRLETYVLVVGDGGLVAHTRGEHPPASWVAAMEPIEPIRFVGRAPPASILFQNGLADRLVSVENAQALHDAARSPKTVKWYDAGHELNAQAVLDRQAWLDEKLGLGVATTVR